MSWADNYVEESDNDLHRGCRENERKLRVEIQRLKALNENHLRTIDIQKEKIEDLEAQVDNDARKIDRQQVKIQELEQQLSHSRISAPRRSNLTGTPAGAAELESPDVSLTLRNSKLK